MAESYRGDGLEFSSFGWFPQFNKVSCLNFVCISSSKMYTNRYWVTKIARMRVFSFFIQITSGHRTLSRKASFWTIRTLSKDYGRIWYGDRKYFSRRPSITQLSELKIPRRFERSRRRLKMYSRLLIIYRDYSNLHSFPHHNWFYLPSPLHSNHKPIKPFRAQNPLPVKRNFTQILLTRTSNHNDLAALEKHERFLWPFLSYKSINLWKVS